MNKNKKLAFTLAEVLIVIGIIGVVAALTLPNLNHATGDKEKVTKVKKIYSALTDAVDRAQVIYGPINTWNKGVLNVRKESERFAKHVTEFMKVSKNCGLNEGCFSSSPLLLSDGSDGDGFIEDYFDELKGMGCYMVMLSDGISLGFDANSSNWYHIRVDIDGPNKGKNQFGNDIFDFSIYVDDEVANFENATLNQLYPSGYPEGWTGSLTEMVKGNYSTAWVIENGNLDYLKCYDELNWETKTSCE